MKDLHKPKFRLKFRAVGVACREPDRQVLLVRAQGNPYWSLPGGCVEPFESSSQALEREMCEETGLRVNAGRLIWITENFFERRGKTIHELALYYQMSFVEPAPDHFEGMEKDVPLFFEWVGLDRLPEMTLVPLFLRDALQHIPENTQHLVLDSRPRIE